MIDENNIVQFRSTPSWYEADKTATLQAINRTIYMPKPLPKYTILTLPPATDHEGTPLYVSNGAGNRHLVISNGTAWYYADGTAV
jgi:hypothetical protein